MNAAFPSFLSENSNRAYPFTEDSVFMVPGNSTGLPDNDIFLDFRGWSRLKLRDQVTLFLVDPVYDTHGHLNYPGLESYAKTGYLSVFFKAFYTTDTADVASQVACFYVPLDESQVQWPYTATASGQMPNGKKSWEANLTVTSKILQLIQPVYIVTGTNEYITTSDGAKILALPNYSTLNSQTPQIEPGQFFEIGGAVVDQLNVVSSLHPETNRYLSGDIQFLPGINTSIFQSGSTITAVSQLGLGTGRKVYTGTELGDPCEGVLKINGVAPDDFGQFHIKGGNGILVEDVPELNLIRIGLDKTNKAYKCPPA